MFSGTESARALLFPMEKVFEAYVAKNLKKRLNQAGWDVSIQDKGYYLFDTLNGEKYQKFALRPDLVITRPDESIIILDTKWKSLINNKKRIMVFLRLICIRCTPMQRNIKHQKYGCYIQ